MQEKQSLGFDKALSSEKLKEDEDWIIRFGFLIHDCARLRRIVLDEKFKPLGITRSQAWLMAYLSRSEGAIQSHLAEQMSLGNVAIGALIDRLEAINLLERRRSKDDRRGNRIFLTPEGKKVIRKMRKLTLEANKDILEGIDIKQLKTAVELMSRLSRNLKQIKSSFGR